MKQVAILAVSSVCLVVLSCTFFCQSSHGRQLSGYAEFYSGPPLLSEIIEQERRKWNLPKGIIEGLIFHESKFDETAVNPERESRCYKKAGSDVEREKCSSSGLMQIVYGLHGGSRHERLAEHVARGTAILGRHWRRTHSIVRALSLYNGDLSGRYAAAVLADAKRFGYRG